LFFLKLICQNIIVILKISISYLFDIYLLSKSLDYLNKSMSALIPLHTGDLSHIVYNYERDDITLLFNNNTYSIWWW